MIYQFNNFIPVIHPSAFVHPMATVTGNVIIGANVYVGPGAALRGDWGKIIIKDGCNVQENCTLHMFPGTIVTLEKDAHIGHGAIIHGATIGENSMIGMNSVIMDDVIIGKNCIIGALCFIKAGQVIPDKTMVVGNPGKIIKEVSEDMIDWKSKGTRLYQTLPQECKEGLKECLPLQKEEEDRPIQDTKYSRWFQQ
ncbi:MAG: hypothetical protein RLZZ546_3158 [Bacteroidota bacterium]|jgi:carbonic anhydrase/acetyltransferase-like protein (isoleucine patch superfamily)